MRRSRPTLISLLAVFLIVAACGDDDATRQTATDAPSTATEAMSGELNALLPDDIREAGVIKAGGPVTETNESCADPMEIKVFPGISYAQLAVRSGQVEATFGGGTALNYLSANAEDGTVFEVASGGPYTVQPDAFAFLKGNDELRDAVQAALQRRVDNGSAAKILEKYGADSGGLYDPIPINVVE